MPNPKGYFSDGSGSKFSRVLSSIRSAGVWSAPVEEYNVVSNPPANITGGSPSFSDIYGFSVTGAQVPRVASWAEQDSAHAPTVIGDSTHGSGRRPQSGSYASCQDGSLTRFIYETAVGIFSLIEFNTSTKKWTAAHDPATLATATFNMNNDGQTRAMFEGTGRYGGEKGLSLRAFTNAGLLVGSDGTLHILYNLYTVDSTTTDGNGFTCKVMYQNFPVGGPWSTPIEVSVLSTSYYRIFGVAGIDSSNRVHCIFMEGTAGFFSNPIITGVASVSPYYQQISGGALGPGVAGAFPSGTLASACNPSRMLFDYTNGLILVGADNVTAGPTQFPTVMIGAPISSPSWTSEQLDTSVNYVNGTNIFLTFDVGQEQILMGIDAHNSLIAPYTMLYSALSADDPNPPIGVDLVTNFAGDAGGYDIVSGPWLLGGTLWAIGVYAPLSPASNFTLHAYSGGAVAVQSPNIARQGVGAAFQGGSFNIA